MNKNKKIIIFDLDGTLTESRTPMTNSMKVVFEELLKKYYVAVISGGIYEQFRRQLIDNLEENDFLKKLFILPGNGTSLYKYDNGWTKVYEDILSVEEKEKISSAMKKSLELFGLNQIFSDKKGIIEDKGGQISLSVFNPTWPVFEKKEWDPDQSKRKPVRDFLENELHDFEVRIGGTTTIDVTKKGIHKGFAVRKILEYLNLLPEDALFFGDAIFPGGNDYAVAEVVESIKVKDYLETENHIKSLL